MGRPCITPRATDSTSRQRAQKTAYTRATSSGEKVAIGRQMALGGGGDLVLGSQQTTIVQRKPNYITFADDATVQNDRDRATRGRNVERPSSRNAGREFGEASSRRQDTFLDVARIRDANRRLIYTAPGCGVGDDIRACVGGSVRARAASSSS